MPPVAKRPRSADNPTYADLLALYINAARLIVERDRRMIAVLLQKEEPMGKIDEFADDTNIIQVLEDEFGGLHTQLKALEEKGGEVADKWRVHIKGRREKIAQIESAINRVSNVPLPPSAEKPKEPPTVGVSGTVTPTFPGNGGKV